MDSYFEQILKGGRKPKHDEPAAQTDNSPTQSCLIYSFIDDQSILSSLKSNKINIFNLSATLSDAIVSIHKNLPNEFTSSDDIVDKIISSLTSTINDNKSKYNSFFLPVINTSTPFDLLSKFPNLAESTNLKPIIINPSFSLILKQIESNYHTSPYRLTLNQNATYLIKNYKQSDNDKHSITFNSEDLKSTLSKLKSAFIDENDFNSFVDSLTHQLLTTPSPTAKISLSSPSQSVIIDADTIQSITSQLIKIIKSDTFDTKDDD